MSNSFPFSAIVGQDEMKLAILVAAIAGFDQIRQSRDSFASASVERLRDAFASPVVFKPGKIRGSERSKFKPALNKIGRQAAPMFANGRGAGR